MGIISKIQSLMGLGETKSLNSEYGFNGNMFVPIDSAGNYTVLSNNNAYSKVGIVYMVVSKIARRVGDAVIEHKQDDDEKTIIKNSPVLKLLKNPNPYQTLSDFLAEIASYKLLDGQYYIWKEKVIGRFYYWVIPPKQVIRQGDNYLILGRFTIPKTDILHYRDFVPNYMVYDDTVCLSPIEVAGINLRVIDYASAANYKTLKGGAVQGVAYEKPVVGMQGPTPEDTKTLRDLLIRRYNSPESHGEVTIHSNEVGYTAFGLKPTELMILDNIMFNEERICDIYNYPRILLGDKGGSLGGNIRTEAKKEFILDAVFPVLSIIVQSLTRLFELQDQNITWDRDAFPELQMDWVTTSQSLERMPYLNYNEKRKVLGYEPDPQFEGVYFMPNNITTLDEIIAGGEMPSVVENDGDFL